MRVVLERRMIWGRSWILMHIGDVGVYTNWVHAANVELSKNALWRQQCPHNLISTLRLSACLHDLTHFHSISHFVNQHNRYPAVESHPQNRHSSLSRSGFNGNHRRLHPHPEPAPR